jgi:hypothetical protein
MSKSVSFESSAIGHTIRKLNQLALALLKTRYKFYLKLSPEGKKQHRKDKIGLPGHDPGADKAIKAAVAWLCRAQDMSISQDGGVAYRYNFFNGWVDSYPETTGYIVPTIIAYARLKKDRQLIERAERMLDWLSSIQLKEGGFKGGQINSKSEIPVTFNTGQILLGLASGVREFGQKYMEPMRRAADWLTKTQEPDGCWRRYPSPHVISGDKAYDTHVAWGLLEAAKIDPIENLRNPPCQMFIGH